MPELWCPWWCGVSEDELMEAFLKATGGDDLEEGEVFEMFCPKCIREIRIAVEMVPSYQCYKVEAEKPPDDS